MNISVNSDFSLNQENASPLALQNSQSMMELSNPEKDEKIIQASLKSLMGIKDFSGPIFPLNEYPTVSTLISDQESVLSDISYKTTQLYKERIKQLTYPEINFPLALRPEMIQFPDPALSYVGLPALFAMNILIRPPLPSEEKHIWKELHMPNYVYEKDFISCVKNEGYFFSCVKNQGYFHKKPDKVFIDRVFVAGSSGDDKKIDGAIHFRIKFKPKEISCHIISLKIRNDFQGKGLGKLLLSQAILTSFRERAQNIILESTSKGVPLYTSFGFVPHEYEGLYKGWWDRMTLSEKMIICYKYCKTVNKPHFRLELSEKNLKVIIEKIDSVFNPTTSSYCDFRNTKVPREAITNGILEESSSDEEDSSIDDSDSSTDDSDLSDMDDSGNSENAIVYSSN